MYLSYSGFKKSEECPKAYWHSYINRTKPPVPDNRVGMLYGSIVGTVFEHFYNDKLWRSPNVEAALQALVIPITESTVKKETTGKRAGILNWKDPKLKKGPKSLDEVIEQVRETIPNGLRIIRNYKFLGLDARAEVVLDSYINGHQIAGRSDFRFRRLAPHGDKLIVDGKGSAHRDKYVDGRQLLWYAMLEREKTGALPDKLAFLFWREEPGNAVDWVTPTKDAVDELKHDILVTVDSIIERTKQGPDAFPARARPFTCKFCPYVFACPEGQVMNSTEKRPQVSGASGVEDVTLGDE